VSIIVNVQNGVEGVLFIVGHDFPFGIQVYKVIGRLDGIHDIEGYNKEHGYFEKCQV